MKTFSTIAATTGEPAPPSFKEEVQTWFPVIVALLGVAVAYGVFKTKMTNVEDKIKAIEDDITKKEESKDKQRDKDIEYFKELLENNNRILLSEIQSEGKSVKQSLQYMAKLIQNRDQTVNEQRNRLSNVEESVNQLLGIWSSRYKNNPPSNPPDYRTH